MKHLGQRVLDAIHPSTEQHPDDTHVVQEGRVTGLVAKMLRLRRIKTFANKITGPVHDGRLEFFTLFSYAMPSFGTGALTAMIGIWMIDFYERLGADLATLTFFIVSNCKLLLF